MVDRSYLRPGGIPGWGVKGLVGVWVAALLIFVFWGSPLYPAALGLVPARAFSDLELWRVFTAPLWLGSLDRVRIAPLVLSLFCLFALGSPLERWLGTWRFLLLFGAALLIGHLGAAILGLVVSPGEALGGPAPGAWAVVAALSVIYWNHQVYLVRALPLRGRHLGWGLAAGLLIALLVDWKDGLSGLPFAADALGGAVGLLFVTRSWRPWHRRPKARSRFVLLKGGAEPPLVSAPPGGKKGNGRGSIPGQPKEWN